MTKFNDNNHNRSDPNQPDREKSSPRDTFDKSVLDLNAKMWAARAAADIAYKCGQELVDQIMTESGGNNLTGMSMAVIEGAQKLMQDIKSSRESLDRCVIGPVFSTGEHLRYASKKKTV